MVDGINLAFALELASKFGTLGVLILVWWTDRRQIREQAEIHKRDLNTVLDRYKQDMIEQREMYRNNVRLVEDYENVCKRLDKRDVEHIDTIRLNTQAYQKLTDFLENRIPCYQRIREAE